MFKQLSDVLTSINRSFFFSSPFVDVVLLGYCCVTRVTSISNQNLAQLFFRLTQKF